MTEYQKSRRERFKALEQSSLQSLPAEPFLHASWLSIPQVPKDYHVRLDHHHYSVPEDAFNQIQVAANPRYRLPSLKDQGNRAGLEIGCELTTNSF